MTSKRQTDKHNFNKNHYKKKERRPKGIHCALCEITAIFVMLPTERRRFGHNTCNKYKNKIKQ